MGRSKADLEAEVTQLREELQHLRVLHARQSVPEGPIIGLLSHMPVLLWCADRDLRFTFVAGGLHHEGILGTAFSDYFLPASAGVDPLAAVAEALEAHIGQCSAVCAERAVRLTLAPLLDSHGKVAGVIGLALDDTARQAAERDAFWAVDRFRTLLDLGSETLYAHDLDGYVTFLGQNIERTLGYRPEELRGRRFEELLTPDSRAVTERQVQAVLSGSGPRTWDANALSKSGAIVPLELRCCVMFEADHPCGIQGVVRDVSVIRRAEDRIRRAESLERAVREVVATLPSTPETSAALGQLSLLLPEQVATASVPGVTRTGSRVLAVAREQVVTRVLQTILSDGGFEVIQERAPDMELDAVVADDSAPGRCIEELRAAYPGVPVIVAGVDVEKPYTATELVATVRTAIRQTAPARA